MTTTVIRYLAASEAHKQVENILLFIVIETKLENNVVLYNKTGRSKLTLVRLVLSKVGPTGPEVSKVCHDENHKTCQLCKTLGKRSGILTQDRGIIVLP